MNDWTERFCAPRIKEVEEMKKITAIWLCSIVVLGSLTIMSNEISQTVIAKSENLKTEYTPYTPIRINSNVDFNAAHGVVNDATGDGSYGNPWIIEGWEIDGTGISACIYIGNTTEHFYVQNCSILNADSAGVELFRVENGTIFNNSIVDNYFGIDIDQTISSNITDNNITRGLRGIIVTQSEVNISHNTFWGYMSDGVLLETNGLNNIVFNNSFFNLYNGVRTSLSSNTSAVSLPPPDDGIDGLQYINGNWNVTGVESYSNETIVLTGNLTVESGGTLIFNNVTLKMNCTTNGTYYINVTSSGSFYIYDLDNDNTTIEDASVITSNYSDGEHRYLFWVWKDANFSMKNSELHECGFELDVNRKNSGLFIETDNATIDHCLFSSNCYGLSLLYANITLSNNIFKWNNGTESNGIGIRIKYSSPYILNNLICYHPWPGITLLYSNATIKNNRLLFNRNGINIATFESEPLIIDNEILSCSEDGIFISAWASPKLINVFIDGAVFGIASTTGAQPKIINTTIINTTTWDLRIGPDCHFTTINCTFDITKVYLADSLANLTVQNYLHTYVNDTNDQPVANADIEVKNITGTSVFTGQTGADGWRKWVVVTEYVQNDANGDHDGEDPGEKVYQTPHNITVSKSGYYNGYSEPNMNENITVIVTLSPDMGFNITLDQGWNLVSLPFEQHDESIDQALSSIAGRWDCIRTYDSLTGTWKTNITGRPNQLNDFNTLNHEMGFWINITEPGGTILTCRGYDPPSITISLYAGWNLVGYPSLANETVANALWGTGADKVMVCDTSEPYHIKEVGPTYVMKQGEGYWVHVPADSIWIVNW